MNEGKRLAAVAAVIAVLVLAVALFRSVAQDRPSEEASASPTRADGDTKSRATVRRRRNPPEVERETSAPIDESSADRPRLGDASVVGVVRTPDGAVVPDAFVVLGDLDDSTETTTTGANGRFALDSFPSYSSVHAFAPRGGEVWQASEPVDGGPWDLTLTLRRPRNADRAVLVRVLGTDGSAVPRARAAVVSGTRRRWRWRFEGGDRGLDVAGGWFDVALAEWRGPIVVMVYDARDAEGHSLPVGSALVTVDPLGPPVVEMRLPAAAVTHGLVENPDGSPAAGVSVKFSAPEPDDVSPFGMTMPPARSVVADGEGRFSFVGPSFVAVAPDPPAHAGASTSANGDAVTLRLRAATTLRFHVTDEADRAVPGASVVVLGARRDAAVEAKAEGFLIEVAGAPAGEAMSYLVRAPGFVAVQGRIAHASEETTHVVLSPEAPARGRVEAPDGSPLADVPIVVEQLGEHPVTWLADEFAVHGFASGERVSLALTDGSRHVASVEAVAGGDEVVLRWPAEPDRLTLVVPNWGPDDARDPSNPGVVVRSEGHALRATAGRLVSIPTDGLPPVVDVQVGPDSHGDFALLRRVASHGFVRVEMTRGARLSGHVTVPDGRDPTLVPCVAEADGEFVLPFETDTDGDFVIEGLPPGPVTVSADAASGLSGRVVVEAPSARVTIALTVR